MTEADMDIGAKLTKKTDKQLEKINKDRVYK